MGEKVHLLFNRFEVLTIFLNPMMFSCILLIEASCKVTPKNNLLFQFAEEESKYQANDRGSYSSLIDFLTGGYRLGAR